jgi:prepilin-type N-terminal cleavage/methylation domain-containing protein
MLNRKTPNKRSREAGFSLIELMVVVTIIGVLGAIAVPRYISYVRSSETAEVAQMSGQIVSAIAGYIDSQSLTPANAKSLFDKTVLTADAPGTATALETVVPQINLPKRAAFNYAINATVATAGVQTGEMVLCVVATGRSTSGASAGLPNGVVLYSSAPALPPAANAPPTGWEGRINKRPYLSGTAGLTGAAAPNGGGYCLATGLASDAQL